MALTPRRRRFGGSSADVAMSSGENNAAFFAPAQTLWAYDAKTGGNRVTDLRDVNNQPITEVVSDATGAIPEFRGPVDVTDLWLASADGVAPQNNPRVLLAASDLFVDVEELSEAVDGIVIEAGVKTVNDLTPDPSGNLDIGPEDLDPPAATQTSVGAVSAIVGARVLQVGMSYPARPTAAQWAIFVGSLDPAANAVDGDLWAQPETT